MQHKIIHLAQTASTNDYLRTLPSPQDDSMTVVYADWQTAGRGQGSNELAANCLHKVAHSYSQQSVAMRYIEVYNELIALKRYII